MLFSFAVWLGSDNKIVIWNVGTGEAMVDIELEDMVLSASFNYDGSRLACTSKDKKLHIINPHNGEVISVSYLFILSLCLIFKFNVFALY